MKKLNALLFCFVALCAAATANAEGYNRVAISYDYTHFGMNKEMKADFLGDEASAINTNGFGINYIHGFGISSSLPMFIETGLNFNFGFGNTDLGYEKESIQNYWMSAESKLKSQNINLQVPVNFVYRFDIADNLTLSPYVGLNFKLNLVTKYKSQLKVDTNIPSDILDQAGIDIDDYNRDGDWINVYSDDDKNMGDKDLTWNRFQMGWHIGVGVQYKPFYLGLQFGTDFIPAYKQDIAKETYKVSTSNLKISLGYCF